eukprot:5954746-Pyramimonas_sp.AAC.1
MSGCHCHVDDACKTDSVLMRAVAVRGLRVVPTPSVRIGVFVVADPSKPGQRAAWISALTSARLVVPEFVQTNGRSGACVVHKPAAITQRRKVWISDAFLAAHPRIGVIIDEARRLPQSKWIDLRT